MHRLITALIVALIVALAGGAACAQEPDRGAPTKIAPAELLAMFRRAKAPGYRMLLRQLYVPADRERFGEFFDHGPLRVSTHAGHRDLPAGYWVYVHPYWYVFRDRLPAPPERRYGPEQAAGPPTAKTGGDSASAWCPKTLDSPGEWLIAEFDEPVKATALLAHENYTPGAVQRITLLTLDGREVELWKADRIGGVEAAMRILRAELPLGFSVTRIKLYLATKEVPGWQEIDAIGLVDDKGREHWASAVAASSTYAQAVANVPADAPRRGPSPEAQPVPTPPKTGDEAAAKAAKAEKQRAQRIEALEKRLHELTAEIERQQATLEALRAELRALRK